MKKVAVLLGCFLPLLAVAIGTGDRVEKLNLKPIKNTRVSLLNGSYSSSTPYKDLRIVTVFGTFFPNSVEHLLMLEYLAVKHEKDGLKIIAFSPEVESDIENFVNQIPQLQNVYIGWDTNGEAANLLLDGALFSARSFIVNSNERVIWDGATDDLPDAIASMFNNTFDGAKQSRVSQLQKQLEQAIASSNTPEAKVLSEQILSLSPSNSMALRGYMMATESAGTPEELFAFINQLHQTNPEDVKLYFALLEQCAKFAQFAPKAGEIATKFAEKFPEKTAQINQICWGLLNNFPLQSSALKATKILASKLESAPPSPEVLTTLALYNSRIGKLEKAIELQTKAIELSQDSTEKAILTEFLNFYKTALN